MSKKTKEHIYTLVIIVLALASVVLAVLDLTKGLSPALRWADRIIYFFFVGDYMIRLALSKEKAQFIQDNILDLVAILPFNSALRAVRLLRLSKAVRFIKLLRVLSVSTRLISRTRGLLDTNGLKYVLILSGFVVLGSSFLISYLEKMSFFDALWWSFVTVTTVGYGDVSPSTDMGRGVAIILMLVGIGLIGALSSSLTSYFLRPNEDRAPSSDRVEMVSLLYDNLNEAEKQQFLELIDAAPKEKDNS